MMGSSPVRRGEKECDTAPVGSSRRQMLENNDREGE